MDICTQLGARSRACCAPAGTLQRPSPGACGHAQASLTCRSSSECPSWRLALRWAPSRSRSWTSCPCQTPGLPEIYSCRHRQQAPSRTSYPCKKAKAARILCLQTSLRDLNRTTWVSCRTHRTAHASSAHFCSPCQRSGALKEPAHASCCHHKEDNAISFPLQSLPATPLKMGSSTSDGRQSAHV